MAQAMINAYKQRRTIGTQTGESEQYYFYLPNKNKLRLYHSPVYKERVASFNICSSKSFFINLETWIEFKKLLPKIDNYLQEKI